MAERPTRGLLAAIRLEWERGRWGIPAQGAGERVGILLAEVDALTARAVAAERHLQEAKEALGIEPGDNLAHRIRMAKESGEHQVRAAEQRVETAELALTLTREAGEALDGAHQRSGYAMFGRRVLAEAQAHWAATLAAKATDLAEAQRRELRAEGMEEVAVMLERVGEGRSSRATKAMAAAMRGGAK